MEPILLFKKIYKGATARVHGQSSLKENINTKRREAGRPSFPQITHSNNSGVFTNVQLEEK